MNNYKKNKFIFSTVLAAGLSVVSAQACVEKSSQEKEKLLGMAALVMMNQNPPYCEVKGDSVVYAGITYAKGGTGTVSCYGNSLEAAGEVHLSAQNANHPLLSAELGYRLKAGGELSFMGGISQPGSDKLIQFGHGFTFAEAGAKFKGRNAAGNSVLEEEIKDSSNTAYAPGNASQKVCAEAHMGTSHTDVHVLINWKNGGCSGITSEAQADAEYDDTGREAPSALTDKKYFGFIMKDAVIESLQLYPKPPKFAH